MTAGKRICLITPGHLSTNPRIVKEADALSAAGYMVTVISARYASWGDEADKEFDGRAWTSLRVVKFGPMASRSTYVWQSLRRLVAQRLCRLVKMPAAMVEAALHPAASELARAAGKVAADLYIAHYTAALPAAARAARKHNAMFGFDAEDFHPGDLPDLIQHAQEKFLIAAVERSYLPHAQHLTAASPGIAAAYAGEYQLRMPDVVLNVFPRPEAGCGCAPDEPRQSPSVYWFSQTIGPNRGLECAIKAIALSRSRPRLYLRGRVPETFANALLSLARAEGVADQLVFLPPCLPGELESRGRAYDAGYSGESGFSRNNNAALGNKLFSYLTSGLAVLLSNIPAHSALAPSLGDAARLFMQDDAQSLAQAFDGVLLDKQRLQSSRAAAVALAQTRFNWETESRHLLEIVKSSLASSPKTTRSQLS